MKSLVVAIGAALVTLYFFAPPMFKWKGANLTIEAFGRDPVCSRAIATRSQIDDPWAPIAIPVHRVLHWRLLFPLAWHYLGLPLWLYLAMPFVGCVLALWFTATLVHQHLGNWRDTTLVTILFAALPWSFVSTEWLGYFDSWLVLALLVVAFAPSRWALVAACLLAPWIDERILLALPVCLAVRAIALDGNLRADCAAALASSLPYLIVRLVAHLNGDATASDYVLDNTADLHQSSAVRFVEGLWQGYRAAWPVLILGLALAWKAKPKAGAILAGLTAVTVIGGLFIASDMHRTLMVVCPVLLLGLFLWHDARPQSFRRALPVVVVANLLIPATHALWLSRVPIYYLPTEIANLYSPPEDWNPRTYTRYAEIALARNDQAGMEEVLAIALQLDPRDATARTLLAMLRYQQGSFDTAWIELGRALEINPDSADALFLRAAMLRDRGDYQRARADATRALEVAPEKWVMRKQAEALLMGLPER